MLYHLQALPLRFIRKIQRRPLYALMFFPILVFLTLTCCVPASGQVRVSAGPLPNLARLQWKKQPGVQRHRLQIAKDYQFNDVLLDGVVSGQEHVVTDLPPGRYYWRLLSLDSGRPILQAKAFEVRPELVPRRPLVSVVPANPRPVRPAVPGWMAAIGEISTPIAAQLRSGSSPDIIGVNPQGTVYAINPTIGVALWMSRYARYASDDRNAGSKEKPPVPQTEFLPVVVNGNPSRVVVSYEGGVRALDGLTGREAWATELPGHFVGGLVADIDSRPGAEIYLSDARLNQLISLDASTGAVLSQTKLTERPAGPPVLLRKRDSVHLLVPLRGDAIEVRKVNGEYIRTIRVAGNLTTVPVVVSTARGALIVVGTRSGLATFETNEFTPLAGIVLYGGDYPIGALAPAPGDRAGLVDTLVMISSSGRVVAVNLADGKMKWIAEGFTRAASAVFADVDADGRSDILVPGVNSFAMALSASDGSIIWQSAEEPRDARQARLLSHSAKLIAVTLKDGRTIIVGSDVGGIGLRALQFTGNVARFAAR